ncbi:MAG: UDP-3-O-(3-hydroxymyristoyl)glucosamine N-acyltransferase [candidate division WOR-3 bacterium]|nr:UDP-3-O-(3-hydroxymyristoyl)glucosamine N-acyltransferase [candidate division WOR-3 bacterium]
MRLKDIARIVHGRLIGEDIEIKNIMPPEEAKKDSLTFLFKPDLKTEADAVISEVKIPQKNCIIVPDCRKAMYHLFKKIADSKRKLGISKTAIIEEGSLISKSCTIDGHTVIKKGARIGKGCYLGSNVYIDEDVVIGDYSTIEHNVVIYRNTRIGNYVSIGANSVIGKEGFGYVKFSRYKRISHIGNVVIEDYVEIGSNVCIDRATIGSTVIGSGTKIDNLVHIAHNVRIGKNCLIMGQSGIAGSTVVGDNVVICGQCGISDHLKIGDNVVIHAKSGVFSSLAPDKRYSGIPAREHYMVLKALARLYKEV